MYDIIGTIDNTNSTRVMWQIPYHEWPIYCGYHYCTIQDIAKLSLAPPVIDNDTENGTNNDNDNDNDGNF